MFVALTVWWICLCSIRRAASEDKTITAESGQNVTLRCRAPNSNNIVVEWSRADLEMEYVLLYRDGYLDTSYQHPSFKNRVDLQDRQMNNGDVSLILKNVTTADAGTYECRVFHTRKMHRKRAVLDSDPISIITLSVVPPPGQTGGLREDGGKKDGGEKSGSVGLNAGLSVPAVLLAAALLFCDLQKT
ncbi:programmed cell death 1 ligand 1-like isoform X2 [Archocentrus centrarchus]|uniref:programmed cell death 1 ligand 1-like isoform X2 n=1 Tax=Archocentrus centrarchus TaxID=63155 RepID=UPI0011E9BDCA|nr:programmed cell death 1 ligand 1-like isoform X2 [Archocentrus centrarchus]